MENTNYNFIGPSAPKKHKGESILLSTEIIRFDEFDEQTEVALFITKSIVLIKSQNAIIWEFNIDDIESLTLSTLSTEFIIHMYEEFDERFSA